MIQNFVLNWVKVSRSPLCITSWWHCKTINLVRWSQPGSNIRHFNLKSTGTFCKRPWHRNIPSSSSTKFNDILNWSYLFPFLIVAWISLYHIFSENCSSLSVSSPSITWFFNFLAFRLLTNLMTYAVILFNLLKLLYFSWSIIFVIPPDDSLGTRFTLVAVCFSFGELFNSLSASSGWLFIVSSGHWLLGLARNSGPFHHFQLLERSVALAPPLMRCLLSYMMWNSISMILDEPAFGSLLPDSVQTISIVSMWNLFMLRRLWNLSSNIGD